MAKKKPQAAQKSGGPKAPSGPNPYDSGLAALSWGWGEHGPWLLNISLPGIGGPKKR